MKRVINDTLYDTDTAELLYEFKHGKVYKIAKGSLKFCVVNLPAPLDVETAKEATPAESKDAEKPKPRGRPKAAAIPPIDLKMFQDVSPHSEKHTFVAFRDDFELKSLLDLLPGDEQYNAYVKCGLRVDG